MMSKKIICQSLKTIFFSVVSLSSSLCFGQNICNELLTYGSVLEGRFITLDMDSIIAKNQPTIIPERIIIKIYGSLQTLEAHVKFKSYSLEQRYIYYNLERRNNKLILVGTLTFNSSIQKYLFYISKIKIKNETVSDQKFGQIIDFSEWVNVEKKKITKSKEQSVTRPNIPNDDDYYFGPF